eukprot:g500.t1
MFVGRLLISCPGNTLSFVRRRSSVSGGARYRVNTSLGAEGPLSLRRDAGAVVGEEPQQLISLLQDWVHMNPVERRITAAVAVRMPKWSAARQQQKFLQEQQQMKLKGNARKRPFLSLSTRLRQRPRRVSLRKLRPFSAFQPAPLPSLASSLSPSQENMNRLITENEDEMDHRLVDMRMQKKLDSEKSETSENMNWKEQQIVEIVDKKASHELNVKLLRHLRRCEYNAVFSLFKKSCGLSKELDLQSFHIALTALKRSSRPKKIKYLYTEAKKRGFHLRKDNLIDRLTNTLVDFAVVNEKGGKKSHNNSKDWKYMDEALRICSDMVKEEKPLSVDTYESIARVISQRKTETVAEDLFTIYSEMQEAGVKTSLNTKLAFVCGLNTSKYWEIALQMYKEAVHEAKGKPFSHHKYTAALRACITGHEGDRALSILDDMVNVGLKPNVFSYTAAIRACVESGKDEMIPKLFEDMISSGIRPNSFLCDTFIQTFVSRQRKDLAFAAFELTFKNMSPSIRSFNILLKLCDEENLWEEAYHIVMKMMPACGFVASPIAFARAAKICAASNKVEAAMEIVKFAEHSIMPKRMHQSMNVGGYYHSKKELKRYREENSYKYGSLLASDILVQSDMGVIYDWTLLALNSAKESDIICNDAGEAALEILSRMRMYDFHLCDGETLSVLKALLAKHSAFKHKSPDEIESFLVNFKQSEQ